MATTSKAGRTTRAAYGSDVVVDLLQTLGIEYVALNPGASYRGIHDSLVNYAGGKPEIILCNHEGIAISVAHGYAHAAGKPMAAAVHNVVGLLNASERIYNAWLDNAPVLVIGGTGPMASEQRRPGGDWIHTALVQGEAVRNFTKFDDQPASIAAFADSMLRAYQVANTEPKGPTYVCFDAGLQEDALDGPIEVPDAAAYPPLAPPQANPEALRRTVDLLLGASKPALVVNYIGDDAAVASLVGLAETLGAPVIDGGDLFNFPSRHPLNLSGAGREVLAEADVILALNLENLEARFSVTDRTTRMPVPVYGPQAKLIDISLRHYGIRSWGLAHGKMFPTELAISADVKVVIPTLEALVRDGTDDAGKARAAERTARWSAKHDVIAEGFLKQTEPGEVIDQPFIAQQLWEVIRDHDWSLLDRDIRAGWARRLWDIQHRYQYYGTSKAGIGNALGRAIGAAIANRGTGRLNVHFQPDGDMLFTPSALWTVANQKLPILMVMHNNRSYNNDFFHQESVAQHRERAVENAGVGVHIDEPNVDFATVARGFGIEGIGPIEKPEQLRPALEKARDIVLGGKPALVDVVTPES
jgi:acetolactate synthase-1/2/3 large subunit